MNVTGMGDMAQGYALRQRTAGLKQEIERLTAELTSGQISDVRESLRGNFSFLTDVERRSAVLDSYSIATTEASHFTAAMQEALSTFGTSAQTLSATLISAGSSGVGTSTVDPAKEARMTFGRLISTLNTKIAGRSMFAGNATNVRPVADIDTILTDLTAAIAGATNPGDMVAQAKAWFQNPAGFAASAYQGSPDALSDFVLSPDESLTLDLRATEPELTRALAGAAVAALGTEATFSLTVVEQTELYTLSGQDMLGSLDGIIALQSRVGLAEARIETAATRNAATITSLTMARNTLLEADPYETATKLEEAQFQLQSLYSVTVRMSQLSLVNFL